MNIREKYRRYVDEHCLYSGRGYSVLDHRCRQLFGRVGNLEGRTMLEIGGGEGLFSLWALAHGMEKVMILEPEADGSTHGVGERFLEHRNALNISEERLSYSPRIFQEYEGENRTFDLVLSYNSINHLDERACKRLNRSKSSKFIYLKLLEKVFSLLRPRGHFIISDSGRLNFWNQIGMNSPFSPSIEWEKHQEHTVWISLLNEVGFEFVSLDWHRFHPLRWLGRLGSNRIVARATTSKFILTVRKP